MTYERRCLECGAPFHTTRKTQVYCTPTCREARRSARSHRNSPPRKLASTTARGYGYTHRKRRAELLPLYLGTPCTGGRCGGVTLTTRNADLEHTVPLALGGTQLGDRIICTKCNRGQGNAIARARAKAIAHTPTSQRW